jgi:DNA uptake protein ComE-like DNA-binding protein
MRVILAHRADRASRAFPPLARSLAAALVALTVGVIAGRAQALEINQADRAQLEQLNGIGVALAERILAERERGGAFRDWADLERRIKGLRGVRSERLAAQGVTVNGQSAARARRDEPPRAGGR